MSQIVAHGTLLRYDEVGVPQAPAILFLHGWRSSAAVWQPILNRLKSQPRRMLALDLPGFGGSPALRTAATVSNYAAVVDDFLTTLRVTSVVVVGHSFGGRIALKLATTNPSRVAKLVLVDSAGVRRSSLRRTVLQGMAKIVKPLFRLAALRSTRTKIYESLGASDYVATPELTKTLQHVIGEDLSPLLPLVRQPTLLVWGEDDTETPLVDGQTMAQNMLHAKLVVLPHAGHYSFLDAPDAFTRELTAFLS